MESMFALIACGLLAKIIGSIYFTFKGELFKQVSGTAMGAAISVTTANLTMETIEQKALGFFPNSPKVFMRYVDDCFCILNKLDVTNFLAHLNSIGPAIQFTTECETNGTLPFLDVLVTRRGRDLTFTVYQKSTHTGRYLDFDPNQPTSHKASVVSTLLRRATTICSSETDKKKEKKTIIEYLKENGYSSSFIESIARRQGLARQKQMPVEERQLHRVARISVPYVKKTSEALARVLGKEDILMSHKPTSTLERFMPRPKDRLPKERAQGMVYTIPCAECPATYIGETKNFPERIRQHKNGVRKFDSEHSAIVEHCDTLDQWSQTHLSGGPE